MDLIKIGTATHKLNWLKVQVTRRCNLSCSFCSQADWRSSEKLDVPKFIEQILAPIDVRLLIITGGEPLATFEELLALLKYCQQRGIETGIFSNGTLATEERVATLKSAGLSWARISLNGSCAKVHEASYPRGSYQPTIKGIENVLRSGIKTRVRTTISQANLDDLDAYLELVHTLGVCELDLRPYLPLGDCNPHDHFILSPEQLMQTAGTLYAMRTRYPKLKIKLLPGWFDFLITAPAGFEQAVEECHCGRQYLYVDVNGEISPCAGHRLKVGTLKANSLSELWRDSPTLHQMRAYDQADYCQGCPQKQQCHRSSCSLINYEVHGTFSEVNPLCPVYKLAPNDAQSGIALASAIFQEAYTAHL